jgi:hypothetical protein
MFRHLLQDSLYRVRGNMFVPLHKVGLASHIRHGNFSGVCSGKVDCGFQGLELTTYSETPG